MEHTDLSAQVAQIWERLGRMESQLTALESRLQSEVEGLADYRRRARQDVATLQHEMGQMVAVLESVVSSAELRADAQRAEELLRRARRTLARASREVA